MVFGPRLRRGLDHATEPNDLQEFCTFSAKVHKKYVWYQKQDQINEMMLERFPLRLEACKG